ncbi:MAG: PAS domain-containing protein [Planctomycetota bacterium]|nr:PAS domain-containing protein [Planctomycetota bacterium]
MPAPTVICAWCETTMSEGDPAEPVTHGICRMCMVNASGRELVTLAAEDADCFDMLPFGLVQLDADDCIVIYNRAESELSGCRQEDVLGKRFFDEIAPCTNVTEFRGVLDSLRATGRPALRRMRFAFRFGEDDAEPTLAEIVMTYDPETSRATLLIKAT